MISKNSKTVSGDTDLKQTIQRNIIQSANFYIIHSLLQNYAWGVTKKRTIYKDTKDNLPSVFYDPIKNRGYNLPRSRYDTIQYHLFRGIIDREKILEMVIVSGIYDVVFSGEQLLEVQDIKYDDWFKLYLYGELLRILNHKIAPNLHDNYPDENTWVNEYIKKNDEEYHVGLLDDMIKLILNSYDLNDLIKDCNYKDINDLRKNINVIRKSYKKSSVGNENLGVLITGLVALYSQAKNKLEIEKHKVDEAIRNQGRSNAKGKYMKQLQDFLKSL